MAFINILYTAYSIQPETLMKLWKFNLATKGREEMFKFFFFHSNNIVLDFQPF